MKTIETLYVVARNFTHSNIFILDGKVYDTKKEAESVMKKVSKDLPPDSYKVMTLEDYIQEYGDSRYDEGSYDEGNSI